MKPNPDVLIWVVAGKKFKCQILPQRCSNCGKKGTLVGLPQPLLEKQPDNTNVVCAEHFDGCNHGFFMDVMPGVLSCEWDL